MDELAFLTATEQADLVRRGEVTLGASSSTLYLGRIERLDPELNAFVTVCSEFDEPRDGPFRGVPLPIKDLNETAGILTTFSSRAFADYVPDFDAAVVRRLKDAGFVVLGKTNTPELGITAVTESELNGALPEPVGHVADAGRVERRGRGRRSRQGCRRPRTGATAAARSASRRRAAGCTGSSPPGAASRRRRGAGSRASRRAAR